MLSFECNLSLAIWFSAFCRWVHMKTLQFSCETKWPCCLGKYRTQLKNTLQTELEHVTIGAKRGRPLLLSDDLVLQEAFISYKLENCRSTINRHVLYSVLMGLIQSNRSRYAGLCSKGARGPQATNFCPWATRKTYFFHTSIMLGALDLLVWNLWAPCNFS